MPEVVVDGGPPGYQEWWLWRIPPHLGHPLHHHVGPVSPLVLGAGEQCLRYPADILIWQAVPPFSIDGILV